MSAFCLGTRGASFLPPSLSRASPSLRRGHANLLCFLFKVFQVLVSQQRKKTNNEHFVCRRTRLSRRVMCASPSVEHGQAAFPGKTNGAIVDVDPAHGNGEREREVGGGATDFVGGKKGHRGKQFSETAFSRPLNGRRSPPRRVTLLPRGRAGCGRAFLGSRDGGGVFRSKMKYANLSFPQSRQQKKVISSRIYACGDLYRVGGGLVSGGRAFALTQRSLVTFCTPVPPGSGLPPL